MTDELGRGAYRVDVDKTKAEASIKGLESSMARTGATAEKAIGRQATGALGKLQAAAAKMSGGGGITGAILGGVGIGAGLGVFNLVQRGIGMVVDGMGEAIQAARDDEASVAKLTASLRANVPAWDGNTAAIDDLIAKAQELAFTDDDVRGSMALLVGATHDVAEASRILGAAQDLARLKGIDLQSASEALIKVEGGQYRSLRALGIQLKAGATSTEALAAVQKVAGGQAEAYGKTAAGAAKTLDIKLGEMTEAFGRFLEGPANDFIGFLTDVVDSFGPASAAVQAGTDYVNAYGKALGTTAVKGEDLSRVLAAAAWQDYLQTWKDYLAVNWDIIKGADQTGDTFKWLTDLNRGLAQSTGWTIDAFAVLAQRIKQDGGTWDDFLSAINTFKESLAGAHQPISSFESWLNGMGEVTVATSMTMADALAAMRAAVKHSIGGSLTTLASQMDPWKTAWAAYAAYAKDPFSPKRFENQIQRYARRATDKAAQAAEDGKTRAARAWRELAQAAKNPMIRAMVEVGLSVDQAIADVKLLGIVGSGIDDILSGMTGSGALGHKAGHWKYMKNGVIWVEGKAAGGPVDAFRPYIVGERGPEMFVPRTSGTIVPNGAVTNSSAVTNNYTVHVQGLVKAETPADIGRQMRRLAMLGATA